MNFSFSPSFSLGSGARDSRNRFNGLPVESFDCSVRFRGAKPQIENRI